MSGKPISMLDIGASQGTVDGFGGIQRRLSMRIAKITGVNPSKNTVDVQWLWPINGVQSAIAISRPYVGWRSGVHFVPEVGSIVIIGYAFGQVLMLSYLLPDSFANMAAGQDDPLGTPMRIRQMSPGEVSINSIQNCEIYLHDKVEISDKNGDHITIDPSDSSINLNSLVFYMDNEAGNITMGPVIRGSKTITSDGLPVLSPVGGNALTEFSLTVEKYSNGTIFDGSQNHNLVKLTAGVLVDNNGFQVVDQTNSKVIFNSDFYTSSTSTPTVGNANMKVDAAGNFNFNDGNMLKPTDIPAIPIPLMTMSTGTIFTAQSQQRAAREGDRVVIPFTAPTTSATNHPDLLTKSTFNLTQLQQIASMIMTPFGPCVAFIPGAPDTRLVGEITQGSDSVFIGSLDKAAEKKETLDNTL